MYLDQGDLTGLLGLLLVKLIWSGSCKLTQLFLNHGEYEQLSTC